MGKWSDKYIKIIFASLLDLIYPEEERCLHCEKELYNGEYLCKKCFNSIIFCDTPTNIMKENLSVTCYSAAYYSKVIKDLIIKFKYKHDFSCGNELGRYIVDLIKEAEVKFDLITFVPISEKNYKKRGFNQAEYLANCVGKAFGIEVKECVFRVREVSEQKTLNVEKRWENLKGCFSVKDKKEIENKKILLIDDVLTTGATVFYCASSMMENNANEVIVLTVAKSKI